MNTVRTIGLMLIILISTPLREAFSLTGRINKNNINIRSDSTTYGEIIGRLKEGDTVKIIKEKFEWYKIILPSKFIVYTDKNYLARKDNANFVVTATVLNLRAKPSMSASVIGKVKKGTVLRYAKDEGAWIGVYGFPHAYGWVHKKFVEIVNPPQEKTKNTPQNSIPSAKRRQQPLKGYNIFIARGILYGLNSLNNCPANYKIKNGITTFFLAIHNNVDNLIGKEVIIKGKRYYKDCPYIEVEEVSPLK